MIVVESLAVPPAKPPTPVKAGVLSFVEELFAGVDERDDRSRRVVADARRVRGASSGCPPDPGAAAAGTETVTVPSEVMPLTATL